MREIKFKVWDKISKEWLEYEERVVGWQAPFDKGIIPLKAWVYGSKDGTAFNTLQYCIDSEDFEVVQYTGLKDKNGKEIYEGNILKANSPDQYGYFEGYVLYDNEQACFVLRTEICADIPLQELDEFEIIGNIYKTEHLLNKE